MSACSVWSEPLNPLTTAGAESMIQSPHQLEQYPHCLCHPLQVDTMAPTISTPSQDSSVSQEKSFKLLSLPPELRDIIYSMVFEGCVLKVRSANSKASPESIGLLLASRQTHEEAIPIYYRNLTVEFRHFRLLVVWIRGLPTRYLQLIPKIKMVECIARWSSYTEADKLATTKSVVSYVNRLGAVLQTHQLTVEAREGERKNFQVIAKSNVATMIHLTVSSSARCLVAARWMRVMRAG